MTGAVQGDTRHSTRPRRRAIPKGMVPKVLNELARLAPFSFQRAADPWKAGELVALTIVTHPIQQVVVLVKGGKLVCFLPSNVAGICSLTHL